MLSSPGSGAAFLPVVSDRAGAGRPQSCNRSLADIAGAASAELITHPSRAIAPGPSEAFRREVLPEFASPDSPYGPAQPACSSPECAGCTTAQIGSAQN